VVVTRVEVCEEDWKSWKVTCLVFFYLCSELQVLVKLPSSIIVTFFYISK